MALDSGHSVSDKAKPQNIPLRALKHLTPIQALSRCRLARVTLCSRVANRTLANRFTVDVAFPESVIHESGWNVNGRYEVPIAELSERFARERRKTLVLAARAIPAARPSERSLLAKPQAHHVQPSTRRASNSRRVLSNSASSSLASGSTV